MNYNIEQSDHPLANFFERIHEAIGYRLNSSLVTSESHRTADLFDIIQRAQEKQDAIDQKLTVTEARIE